MVPAGPKTAPTGADFGVLTLASARIIKRYSNRKLYDTEKSRYIKLKEIADLVREGVDVQIIDNETQEDLTGVTLAQLLLDAEKRNDRTLPLATLTEMLRSSGTRIQKSLEQQVTVIREEAERTVVGFRKETGRQLRDFRERTNFEDLRTQIRDFVHQAQEKIDDLQARAENRLRPVEERQPKDSDEPAHPGTGPGSQDDHASRLDALEQRLIILEGIVASWAPPPHEIKDDGPK